MICRWPGFLAVKWVGSTPTPTPLPPSPVSKLSLFLSLPVCRHPAFLTGEGEGMDEEPNYRTGEKAWPSINHSILSGEGVLLVFIWVWTNPIVNLQKQLNGQYQDDVSCTTLSFSFNLWMQYRKIGRGKTSEEARSNQHFPPPFVFCVINRTVHCKKG